MDKQSCKTCKWFEEFNWCCFNGKSDMCADFVPNPNYVCEFWERKEDKNEF